MTRKHWLALCAGAAASILLPQTIASAKSDSEVQRAIRQSIAAYSGSCPCPYSVDRAGRRCGGRSAYSKPGGAAPLCYPADVRRR
ncbi:MAG TPA: hypothetical protein VEZ41_10800 [Allosphingosinicella sp.]|jgi:hypothetical protein|nr:hypothetical protein [Allosphingosinicella sp.]